MLAAAGEFVGGNCIELLRAGEEYFPALEAACDAARHEIRIETYIFEDDQTGRLIAAALTRAAQRGVAVYLLLDGFGSQDLSSTFLESLRRAGVHVLKFRPDISPWTLERQRLRRMHRKIAVIVPKSHSSAASTSSTICTPRIRSRRASITWCAWKARCSRKSIRW